MKRREILGVALGAITGWPSVALAQRTPPHRVGVLHSTTSRLSGPHFLRGLHEQGFVQGQNFVLEERAADGDYARLPSLTLELIDRGVTVIAAFGTPAAHAVKAQSQARLPAVAAVFSLAADPVVERFVESLNRPGGNMTGVTSISGELAAKRLDLIRGLVRGEAPIGFLANPGNPLSDSERRSAEAAAHALGKTLRVVAASSRAEIETAFSVLRQLNISFVIVAADVLYYQHSQLIARLAREARLPLMGPRREFAVEGSLLSYGASIADVNRLAGVLVGRILKGERPADLPVQQPTRFELVLNLKTAKALGLEMPATLLATADEVIE